MVHIKKITKVFKKIRKEFKKIRKEYKKNTKMYNGKKSFTYSAQICPM